MKIVILLLLVSISAFAQKVNLQDGDLLFQDMDCGPLCEAIEAVTEGYGGYHFSHMGMVYHKNDSIYIVEAAGDAVRLTPLEKFSENIYKPMFVGRVKKQYRHIIPAAINFSLQQIGVPYDNEYIYDNGSYYCSELIYDAFMFAYSGLPFFKLKSMTYKQPGTSDYFPAWVEYYKSINKPIPEGLPGCNPGGMLHSDKIDIIGKIEP